MNQSHKKLNSEYTYGSASTSSSSENADEAMHRSVKKNGQYFNPWPTFKMPSFGVDLFKFIWCSKNDIGIPSSKRELDNALPIIKPGFSEYYDENISEKDIVVTWLGHASTLIRMEKINILTDPVFSSRCSPSQLAGTKRYREIPCTVHELPTINVVLISHNHYDHLDLNTVLAINARFGKDVHWFVPMGLARWFTDTGCETVHQLDWWQEECIFDLNQIRFICTPAQHWSKRNLIDTNKSLWCGWALIGSNTKIYFAGDTGYCSVFEQIGSRFGPFDFAAIPIGAYAPRWFLKPQHVDPDEAVQIHLDLKAKKSLGIHWGTFPLSHEPYLEPPQRLKEALSNENIPEGDFFVLKHGETKIINTSSIPSE